MSERITHVSLDDARNMVGRSDWDRVRALSEEQLEAAIASDPNWAGEWHVPYQIAIYRDGAQLWRWRLIGQDGRILAQSHEGLADREHIQRDLAALRIAFSATAARAA